MSLYVLALNFCMSSFWISTLQEFGTHKTMDTYIAKIIHVFIGDSPSSLPSSYEQSPIIYVSHTNFGHLGLEGSCTPLTFQEDQPETAHDLWPHRLSQLRTRLIRNTNLDLYHLLIVGYQPNMGHGRVPYQHQ